MEKMAGKRVSGRKIDFYEVYGIVFDLFWLGSRVNSIKNEPNWPGHPFGRLTGEPQLDSVTYR